MQKDHALGAGFYADTTTCTDLMIHNHPLPVMRNGTFRTGLCALFAKNTALRGDMNPFIPIVMHDFKSGLFRIKNLIMFCATGQLAYLATSTQRKIKYQMHPCASFY
jgi:hypothetical protein